MKNVIPLITIPLTFCTAHGPELYNLYKQYIVKAIFFKGGEEFKILLDLS